jgi:hypothetical protein
VVVVNIPLVLANVGSISLYCSIDLLNETMSVVAKCANPALRK